jgi:hypothetical protein
MRCSASITVELCSVASTRWPVSQASSVSRIVSPLAHLADHEHVDVLAQRVEQPLLKDGVSRPRPRAGG